MLRVKKHRSASKPLHNCSNRCDVSFCNNDHAYMYLYFCMRWWLQLFCSQLQILERRNFVSWKRNFVSSKRYFVSPKRNFASSKRNFVLMTRNFVQRARNFATKFRLIPRNFVSINHLACEISPTLEQQKHRNFAAFLSEAKVRNLMAEIRVISLISANFVCISFSQYCNH